MYPGSGYNNDMAARYRNPSQLISPGPRPQFDATSFPQTNHQVSHPNQFQNDAYDLALGPPQSTPSFQEGNSSLQQALPFDDWPSSREKGVDFMSEEEIRMRSHEMLENEDMQHLLRLFSMGGHAPINGPEDGYGFPSYMPSPSPGFSYNEDRTRSGKAVVGWLKIKAAMRWGIFIRKKAAERRAQLVELED